MSTIDEIMGQAQTFAAGWAIVGGRLDDGSALDEAEETKTVLRDMITAAIAEARREGAEAMRESAAQEAIVGWPERSDSVTICAAIRALPLPTGKRQAVRLTCDRWGTFPATTYLDMLDACTGVQGMRSHTMPDGKTRNASSGPWIALEDVEKFRAFCEVNGHEFRPHTGLCSNGHQVRHQGHWMALIWNKHTKRYTADRRLSLIVQSFAASKNGVL